MQYKEPLITADEILKLFLNNSSILESSIYRNIRPDNPKYTMIGLALRKLLDDKRLLKTDVSHYYRLMGDTLHFIEDGGYETFVDRENFKEKEQSDFNKSILDTNESIKNTNQSVSDTNNSIKTLNEKTKTFYSSQKRTNTINIILTIAILSAAIAGVIVSGLTYVKDKNSRESQDLKIKESESKVKALEQVLSKKAHADSLFQKAVKDSLRIP